MNTEISNNYTQQLITSSLDDVKTKSVKQSSKKKWTDAENIQLSNYIKEYGKNWKRIAEKIPGTTHQQCAYHWKVALNSEIKHGEWSQEEDEKLKQLVEQGGERWSEIAKQIPGRTNQQCRKHYHARLNPFIKHGKWTKEEDDQLKQVVQRLGQDKWDLIAKELSNKTNQQCANRWQVLYPKYNKQRPRSETNSPIEERPSKKFKKNHSSDVSDLNENRIALNPNSTELDQPQPQLPPQPILLNEPIPKQLEQQPQDIRVLDSIFQQSLTCHNELFTFESYPSFTNQDLTFEELDKNLSFSWIDDLN